MTPARRLKGLLAMVAMILLGVAPHAIASDDSLLIQVQPGGQYRVWHTEGPIHLSDDDVMLLDSLATPEGSELTMTEAGPARAQIFPQGIIIISLQNAGPDGQFLVDRDGCGHVKAWHATGTTKLTEDQLTDLVLAAVPGGGQRVVLDESRLAKSFLTPLGVMVAIWRPAARTKP